MEDKLDRRMCENNFYNIRNGSVLYSESTINEMIEYYISTEEYEKCTELKKAKIRLFGE